MEVIFLQNVNGVAHKGDVKQISDGYARNFLLPNGLAEAATPGRVAAIKVEAEHKVAQRAERGAELQQLIEAWDGREITIEAKANKAGGLFAAITPEVVAKHLNGEIGAEQIVMPVPIKTVGEHTVKLRAGADAIAAMTVIVRPL
ncbi:TPA: 50S ribosomal protein L9 [Patescibacteria group bacterium]|uniref:Large ribosomal subunit protein bL9 n=2 Tax=Bacteria division Kazan-3B-28 TaxID=1798534 RepID=A0A0G1X6U4_UNCK3|nr:MAG: 50S ribosomal protein L9, large subunit ribosomal protein L9 [candidate division Kazan bacterium GW2011_GWA1_50_15]KKW25578.1 MAG: LSU ribosomal protein L9P [candidate division Kazan bacterium GW2011_GWC1_52_13]KKW26883.1 MAG: LSU ribosomal protein L9P [candidate division Kazan bacterium GW2011_GWB1_52_7]HAV66126.1 50S ribosomal protein L9 [Patescibacteria group bacterium]HCL47601.1 50S ribosomal protein L9 [Patescibacteria group bacterium]